MLNEEVFVAPLLEVPIVHGVVFVTRALELSVEVYSILLVKVAGRQITSATKPVDRLARFHVGHFEVAVVEMHCRSVRITLFNKIN